MKPRTHRCGSCFGKFYFTREDSKTGVLATDAVRIGKRLYYACTDSCRNKLLSWKKAKEEDTPYFNWDNDYSLIWQGLKALAIVIVCLVVLFGTAFVLA